MNVTSVNKIYTRNEKKFDIVGKFLKENSDNKIEKLP